MSEIPLSSVQEIIERTVFERIRQELVDKGYLPDVTDYSDDQAGYSAYQLAQESIVSSKGFSIDVFNTSSSFEKGIKKVPRIVINSGSFLPGDLGGAAGKQFFDQGSFFKAGISPPQTSNFFLDISLVSANVIQERVLNSILAIAVPRRRYLPFYNNAEKSFFIRYLNYNVDDSDAHDYLEKIYTYEIPDCWEHEEEITDDGIAKISEITMNVNIQKYMNGSWGSDSDPIVVS